MIWFIGLVGVFVVAAGRLGALTKAKSEGRVAVWYELHFGSSSDDDGDGDGGGDGGGGGD